MGEFLTAENLRTVGEAIIGIVGVFALIATVTPNTSDDAVVDFIYRIINLFAANVGKAKNDPEIR